MVRDGENKLDSYLIRFHLYFIVGATFTISSYVIKFVYAKIKAFGLHVTTFVVIIRCSM